MLTCSGGREEGSGHGGFAFDLVEPNSITSECSLSPKQNETKQINKKPFSVIKGQTFYLSVCSTHYQNCDNKSYLVCLSWLHLQRCQRRTCALWNLFTGSSKQLPEELGQRVTLLSVPGCPIQLSAHLQEAVEPQVMTTKRASFQPVQCQAYDRDSLSFCSRKQKFLQPDP